jgi:hypothetical protein
MLPGFRLIALTFCCGFLVVFAGLRLATSVNGLHQAMPVTAAHAAPMTVGAIADRDLRRGQSAVPVMYDLRFAVGNAVPAASGAQPVIDRAPPVMMPLVILPPIALEAERNAAPEADASVVAALALPPAAKPEPPVVIDIPLTEPAPVDLTFAPPAAAKEKPAVAAAAPQAALQAPPRTFDIPLPEPAPIDLTLPPAKPETDGGATVEKRAETDARSKPIELAALATDMPTGTVKLPTRSLPLPRPRAAMKTAAVQTAPAKQRPRRAVARTTQQTGFDNFFGFPTGGPQ